MRKLMAIASLAALAAACSAGAQESGRERADGSQTQRSFEVGSFDKVSLHGSHDVIVSVGGQPSVRAEGDAEQIERLDIRVEGGELRIGSRRDSSWFGRNRGRVTVYVTVPSLSGAEIAGSGDMRIDRVEGTAFSASIAGSGDMDIAALRARQTDFDIAGSGGIRAAGAAEEAQISIAGSGNVSLDAVEMRRASVSIMGSGDVSLRASEAVSGSIMGSGDVTVRGTARCSVSKMGSGDVHCEA